MSKNQSISLPHLVAPGPKPHTSVAQVDEAMKDMDGKYNTQFYSWIRNERNVDYIAYYLQKLVMEAAETPTKSISAVVRWLVGEWSIQYTAELLLKLFYHWGIGHSEFATLVSEVIQDWSSSNIIDLAVAIVIGERASQAAKFVKHLTNAWEPRAILNLVRHLSLRLKWSERYFKYFLLQYLTMCEEEHIHHRMTVSKLRICFESRQNTLNHWCTIDADGSYDTLCSLIEFSMEIFETIVWEMYELRYFSKWNVPCATERLCNNERRPSENVLVEANSKSNGLRVTTSADQFMDLKNQPVYEKLSSPQAAVSMEYFSSTGLM